jgi:hypothetical protein
MLIEFKSIFLLIALTSGILVSAPLSVFAVIEKIEEYAESICSDYQGEWQDGSCKIQNEGQEQGFLDDVASLEDSICEDEEAKEISNEDWIDLCKNINIFAN